jgi:hypothetical protein
VVGYVRYNLPILLQFYSLFGFTRITLLCLYYVRYLSSNMDSSLSDSSSHPVHPAVIDLHMHVHTSFYHARLPPEEAPGR